MDLTILKFERRPVCWICENKSRHRTYRHEECSEYLGVPVCSRCGTRHFAASKRDFPFFAYVPGKYTHKDPEPEWLVDQRKEVAKLYWVELLAAKLERVINRLPRPSPAGSDPSQSAHPPASPSSPE